MKEMTQEELEDKLMEIIRDNTGLSAGRRIELFKEILALMKEFYDQ